MRTTVNIDDPILKDLKKLQQKEGKSLGRLISDLLARALAEHMRSAPPEKPPAWISKPMRAKVNLADTEALYAAMEQDDSKSDTENPS